MYDSLTPEQKARYANREIWRSIDENLEGKNGEARLAELMKTLEKFKLNPMNPADAVKHMQTFYLEGIREIILRATNARIAGLVREYSIVLTVLSREEERHAIHANLPIKQRGKEWKTQLKILEKSVEGIIQYNNNILKEIKDTIDSDFWDRNGIERPHLNLKFD